MGKVIGGSPRTGEVLPFARQGEEVPPTVTWSAQRHLGTNLRGMYDELLQQPLPDRFIELIAQLDTSSEKKQP